MEAQLRLLSTIEPDSPEAAPALESGSVGWRLSASTRAAGREGIEQARAALRSARPRSDGDGVEGPRQQPSAA